MAVGSDEHNALAMLMRRDGETLAQLLISLDNSLGKALDDDINAAEINPGSSIPTTKTSLVHFEDSWTQSVIGHGYTLTELRDRW